jgi:hypothetical protein
MTNRSTPPESTGQEEVAETLVELHEQLALLRESIHQLRSDMHLLTGRPREGHPRRSVLRITSLPKDPTRRDFLQRINSVPPEQLDAMRADLVRAARGQQEDVPK